MPETTTVGAAVGGAYQAQGYLSPIRVMPEAEAGHLAEKITGIYNDHGTEAKGLLGSNPHHIFPDLFDLVCNPAIVDRVEEVLGPDILCWSAGFFPSRPTIPASYPGIRI